MKRSLLVSVGVLFLSLVVGAAEAPLKVLMIGNSFSEPVVGNMPPIAKAMGLKLDIASAMIGGSELERHWNNYLSAQTNAAYRPYHYHRNVCGKKERGCKLNLLEAVTTNDWDIITVQQVSHASMAEKTYRPYGDDLVAALRKLAPQAKIVVQETWYYLPYGKRSLDCGVNVQRLAYAKIAATYADFAARVKADAVIPTGTAVQLFRERLPVVYAENDVGGDVVGNRVTFEKNAAGRWTVAKGSDTCHLSPEGEYLQGLVWTAKLFGADVTACPYVAPVVKDPKRAALMKACAMAAVRGERPVNAIKPPQYVLVIDDRYGAAIGAYAAHFARQFGVRGDFAGLEKSGYIREETACGEWFDTIPRRLVGGRPTPAEAKAAGPWDRTYENDATLRARLDAAFAAALKAGFEKTDLYEYAKSDGRIKGFSAYGQCLASAVFAAYHFGLKLPDDAEAPRTLDAAKFARLVAIANNERN